LTPQAEAKPAETVWLSLLRGHAAARRLLDAGLRRSFGLTAVEYEALLLLSRARDSALRRVDLADGLGLTPSGVTRLLDGLEHEGLVAKRSCSADARVTYAVLTEAGAARLEQASCAHGASVRALFEERFSCEELQTLAQLLGRLPAAGDGDEPAVA
jgi:DNA-binding MarR family transcriptional regulator